MDAKSSLPAVKLSGADKGMRMLYEGYNTSSGSQGSVFKDWSTEVQSPTSREIQQEYAWV